MQTFLAQSQASQSSGAGPFADRPLFPDGFSARNVCRQTQQGRENEGEGTSSRSGVSGPAPSKPPGNVVEAQILRTSEAGTPRVRLEACIFTSPPRATSLDHLWLTNLHIV